MKAGKVLLVVFVCVALAQLYVPAKMILDNETVLTTGTLFKFKTEPVDPTDPLRGKYIRLNFSLREFTPKQNENFETGETIYLSLGTDSAGFANITHIGHQKPEGADCVSAKVDYALDNEKEQTVHFTLPFTRFYMEESKAEAAERLSRRLSTDSIAVTYALVAVKNGEAVIKDVLINGTPIKDLAQ